MLKRKTIKQVNNTFYNSRYLHVFYYSDQALGKRYTIGLTANFLFAEYYERLEAFKLTDKEVRNYIMENI